MVGSWRLIADQEIDENYRVTKQDTNVDGLLIYDADGNMSVQIVWNGVRAPMMTDSVMRADGQSTGIGPGSNSWTAEQRGMLIDSYDAYFGTYTVDWSKGIITHILSAGLRPDKKSTEFKRPFILRGDSLFIHGGDLGQRWQVAWVRASR